MASTGKVRARLAAAVESVLGGIVPPRRRGPQQRATRSNVEPLEQRVLFSSTPAWLAPGSSATWDPNTHALTVTGPAPIVADPGADEPQVTVSGSGAALTIEPTSDTWVHLGSITLTGGGRAEVSRPNAGSFDENASVVLELGLAGDAAATPLSIDSGTGSTLGIEDNDLIVRGGTDAVPAYIWNVAVQAGGLPSPLGTLNPTDYHQDGLATPDEDAAAQWDVAGRSLTLDSGDALVKYFPAGEVPAWTNPGDASADPTGSGPTPVATREQIGPRYVASMFAQPDLASGPTPAYVVSAVVNGNNPGLLGPQRSMVDDVEYTFSEPVTLDPNTAFTIAVQSGQTGTLPTLAWSAVNPDASGAATQWDVTFGGTSVIAGSIANGVYVLTLNPAAVTSEANPSVLAQVHNPDVFFRLFGDGDANGVVNDADNSLFVAAQTTYNPAFDYNGDGAVNNADNFQFKKDQALTYTGTISFSPAALRPTDVSAAVTGPNSVTLAWTGPSDPNVSGYSVQRWTASSGTWTTVATGLPTDSTSFTDPAAPAGDTCEYEVAAEETGLTSDWSLPSNDVAMPTVAPANLVVVRTDAGVVLQWDAVPGATQFTLYRQGPGDDGFVALTPTTTATTYTDSYAGSDATYVYYVTATFPAGESAPSESVGARTLSDPAAGNEMFWGYDQTPQTPDAYSDFSQGAGGEELGIQFAPTAAGYITGIQFYKGVLNTGLHVGNLWAPYGGDGTPLATAAFNDESESGWQQVDFSQPVAVSPGFTYTASYFGTTGYYADDEGYFADGGPGAQGMQTANTQAPANGNGVETLDGGGFPQGWDGANYWVQPIFYPAAPGADFRLSSPTDLTATALSDSAVHLNWSNNSTGATALTVLVSTDGASFSPVPTLPPLPANQTACTVTGLQGNTPYWFKVAATNPAGASAESGVASVRTLYTTPTIASPATAAQSPVTGTTDALSVLGAVPGGAESALTYTWSVVSGPSGATFSTNGSNAAKNTTVTFAAAGTYTFQAEIQNGAASVTSSIQVIVNQTLTGVTIDTPVTILPGETEQLTAVGYDQFGAPMDPPPAFTWSVASGGGSVDGNGTFTAPSMDGSSTVQATAGGFSALVQVTADDSTEGIYQVTLGDRSYESDFYNGRSSGELTVTKTGWIVAASPQDAVRQAVSGTVTLDTPYDDGNATLSFPNDLGSDFGFALLGFAGGPSGSQYNGQIGMWDGDTHAPADWDFYWNVTVQQAQFSSLTISDSSDQTNWASLSPSPQTNNDFFIADTGNGDPILQMHAEVSPNSPDLLALAEWKLTDAQGTVEATGNFGSGDPVATINPTDDTQRFTLTAGFGLNDGGAAALPIAFQAGVVRTKAIFAELRTDPNLPGGFDTVNNTKWLSVPKGGSNSFGVQVTPANALAQISFISTVPASATPGAIVGSKQVPPNSVVVGQSVNGVVKSSNAVIEAHIKNANALGGAAAKAIDSVSIDVLDPKTLSVAAFAVTDPNNQIPVAPPNAQALINYLNSVYQRQAAITFTLAGNQVQPVNVNYDNNGDLMLQNPKNPGQANPTLEFDLISQAPAIMNVAADRKLYYVVAMVPMAGNNPTESVGWAQPAPGKEAAVATFTGFNQNPVNPQNVPADQLLYVSAHEMGHLLGLDDVPVPNVLMSADLTLNPGFFPKLTKADWDTANANAK